jgi:hypothetical protein
MPTSKNTFPARRAVQPPARQTEDMSHRLCDEILVIKEKVAALEAWRASTEADLKEIRDVISQVKLLITLSIGGGGLSIITLIITISRMIHL